MNIQSNFNPAQPISRDIPEVKPSNSSAAPAQALSPASAEPEDQAHLSQAAVLASASSSLSEVRAEKVTAVQQALAGGTYAVSPSDVAGKVIDHLLQN